MRRKFGVLVLVLGLVGCSPDSRPERARPDPLDIATLRVTGSKPVPGDELVRLSPGGGHLLRITKPSCVTALDGSGEQCVDPDEVIGDLLLATWSPDGTKLAFTENFRTKSREPDVWVFDVTTGDLRNITDDGRDGYAPATPDPGAHLDVLPSWSPDGRTVRFARGHVAEETMKLMSVPVGGGEPSTVRDIGCGATRLAALALSAEQVAWVCHTPDIELWLADQDGGAAENVLPGSRKDFSLLSFSPDGRWLLADSSYLDGGGTTGGDALAVPTHGGAPVPVADGPVAFPAWSPEGHAIAYIDLRQLTLNVVAEPGTRPRELDTASIGFSAPDGLRLQWAPDKLLIKVDGEHVLLGLTD